MDIFRMVRSVDDVFSVGRTFLIKALAYIFDRVYYNERICLLINIS